MLGPYMVSNQKIFLYKKDCNFEPFCFLIKSEKRPKVNRFKFPLFWQFCCQYTLLNYPGFCDNILNSSICQGLRFWKTGITVFVIWIRAGWIKTMRKTDIALWVVCLIRNSKVATGWTITIRWTLITRRRKLTRFATRQIRIRGGIWGYGRTLKTTTTWRNLTRLAARKIGRVRTCSF